MQVSLRVVNAKVIPKSETASAVLEGLPECPEVLIELPRWGVVKPRANGTVDFVSPLPCPYNYGSIAGVTSPDGDPLDVVVLGRRIPRNRRVRVTVRGVIGFIDAGELDPKVICSCRPLTHWDRLGLETFFHVYSRSKSVLNRIRGKGGVTRFLGWLP